MVYVPTATFNDAVIEYYGEGGEDFRTWSFLLSDGRAVHGGGGGQYGRQIDHAEIIAILYENYSLDKFFNENEKFFPKLYELHHSERYAGGTYWQKMVPVMVFGAVRVNLSREFFDLEIYKKFTYAQASRLIEGIRLNEPAVRIDWYDDKDNQQGVNFDAYEYRKAIAFINGHTG